MKTTRRLVGAAVLTAAATGFVGSAWAAQELATVSWNHVARHVIERAKPSQHQAVRLLAHLSLAQYAAASQSAATEDVSSVVGTASQHVIAAFFPSQADYAGEQARALNVQASALGRRIAEQVIAHAGSDGFSRAWDGHLPSSASAWSSRAVPPAPPALPAIGSMRTFVIDRGDVYRPKAPPAVGSARFDRDLDELRRINRAPSEDDVRVARFYDMTTGTMAGGSGTRRRHEAS